MESALATLQQYELVGIENKEREIGRGSYASVLEMNYHGLQCAGKQLYSVLYTERIGETLPRFAEECRLLSQLRHPNIVQFLGVHFTQGSPVPILVMEFLPTTLAQRIDKNSELGSLPDEVIYSILSDVALGVNYFHGHSPPIVHRDLSANNILLTKNLTAKISDLGVAKILHLNPLELFRMTKTPGTPCYMPPEALEDNPQYDTSIDIFSYGILLIHIFSGKWPFPTKAVTVDPNDPDNLSPVSEAKRRQQYLDDITPDHPLMDLILRCISNSPTLRPTAAMVLQDVKDVQAQFSPTGKEELLQRVKALSVSLKEAEERMKQNAKIQRLSVRLEAAQKATEELDKAHDNANTLSTALNHLLEQIQDGNKHMNASVGEIISHLNPSKGESGLDANGALVKMEALCSCLEQTQQKVQEKATRVKEAQQAASAYLVGLEQIQEKAREKSMAAEECQDSVQALLVKMEYSGTKAQQRLDNIQETMSAVQEQCSGLEHLIQLEATEANVDSIREQVSVLQISQVKVKTLLRELDQLVDV